MVFAQDYTLDHCKLKSVNSLACTSAENARVNADQSKLFSAGR